MFSKDAVHVSDDNLVYVYRYTEEEHDNNVSNLMNRAREKEIKFSKDNVHLKCQEISFFGHKWTPDGIRPDNKKIYASREMIPS